jgi:LPXTG-motif cell wall-anchored protein
MGMSALVALSAIGILQAGAAEPISATTLAGQRSDGTYTPGNIVEYSEGDSINFRFTLSTAVAGVGELFVRFTGPSDCLFFEQEFTLGTHDSSAPALQPSPGTMVDIDPDVGGPTVDGTEWVQKLDIDFDAPGTVVVNFFLTLSNQAGECSPGSPQSVELEGGLNVGAGNQNVPVPSGKVIDLPDITVTKMIDRDNNGSFTDPAGTGEFCFSLNGGACIATNTSGQVVFESVTTSQTDVTFSITETQLLFSNGTYVFASGSGTNCTFNNLTETATATVAAGVNAKHAACTFNNRPATGQLVVEKQIEGVSGGATFDLNIDGTLEVNEAVDNSSNALTPRTVTTGTHSVSEVAGAAGSLGDFNTTIACTDQDDNPVAATDPGTFATSLSGIQVNEGDTVTCVITNTRKTASIIVEKQTNPDGSGESFDFTASYDGDGFSLTDGQTNDSGPLQPDTPHSVTELVPDGWSLAEPVICSNGDPATAVVLESEETVRCIFNNTQLSTIIIKETTIPAGLPDVFGFTADGPLAPAIFERSDGQTQMFSNPAAGGYTVTQDELFFAAQTVLRPGFILASIDCDDDDSPGSVPNRTAEITLEAGETVTCEFVNVLQQEGTIIVRKEIEEYDEDTTQLFPFDASYDSDGFSLEAGGENVSEQLPAGTYSVEEIVPDGWDLDSVVCSDGSEPGAIDLAADETVICTFTNEREPGYDDDDTDDFEPPFIDAGDPGTPDPSGDTAGTQTEQQPAPAPQPAVVPEVTTRQPDPAGPVALEQLPRTGQGLDRATLMGGLFLLLGGMSILLGRRRKAQKA